MGIGTSLGAYFDDSMHMASEPYLPQTSDRNVVNPDIVEQNKQLDKAELDPTTGLGIDISDKRPADAAMPFPNNRNPDAEFNSRFGTLPPSGILNDMKKPAGETVPLVRKM